MENQIQGAQSFLKLARIMRVVAKIIFVFSLIGACVLAVAAIAVAFVPASSFPTVKNSEAMRFNFGSPWDMTAQIEAGSSYKAIVLSFLVAVVPLCAWCAAFFLFVLRILSSVSAGRPFAAASSRSLRSLAVAVACYPFSIWASTGFLLVVFQAFSVQAPDFRFSYDFTYVVFACLLLVLSGIFRYGEELQVEADETV